ncbi:MAG: hypothetical protein IT158_10780 [Bryobacterales bacterium]|nr:hypothetical protein [Bryobacterales bacterium]
MDLYKSIRELYEQKKRLDVVIASLEELQKTGAEEPKRRGRKQMDAQARQEVSERMRRYWAARRKARQNPPSAGR